MLSRSDQRIRTHRTDVFRAAARDFADIEIVGINDLLEPTISPTC